MMVPLHRYRQAADAPQGESPEARQVLESHLQQVVMELAKLRLDKSNQRKEIHRLDDTMDEHKTHHEKESRALNDKLKNVAHELHSKKQEHANVKQEYDRVVRVGRNPLRCMLVLNEEHSQHQGKRPYVEQQERDGTRRTRIYQTKPKQQQSACSLAGNRNESMCRRKQETPSLLIPQQHDSPTRPSLGAHLESSSTHYPEQHSPTTRHYDAGTASITTEQSLLSTVSFSHYLMELAKDKPVNSSSRPTRRRKKQRRGSFTQGVQQMLHSLEDETAVVTAHLSHQH